jgi:molybdopterin synthase catalytic subunit
MKPEPMITALVTGLPIDHVGLYRSFLERETDSTGTVVLHHGRVKRPGKKIPGFSSVELTALVPDPGEGLSGIAAQARDRFGLNQVLVVHRLGTVAAGDSVLLAIVSGVTRDRCLAACAWIVDEVKKEASIALVECP